KEALRMLDIYQTFLRDIFAIPVIAGEKTPSEKFAGAQQTYSLEAMMQDTKALQACTSHYFGTRFAKAFDIKFQDRNGQQQYVETAWWGMTAGVVGAVIMTHSDDQGLVLPPRAAPTQIVILPILQKNKDNTPVMSVAQKLHQELSKQFKVHLDDREGQSAGF